MEGISTATNKHGNDAADALAVGGSLVRNGQHDLGAQERRRVEMVVATQRMMIEILAARSVEQKMDGAALPNDAI